MDKYKIFYWVAINLFVALLYSLAAYFGLLVAVPPGYATPLFPSSGIALGSVLVWGLGALPGIFFGSFVINTYLSVQEHHFLVPYLIGCGIATGAVLQAIAGYYLIKKNIALNHQFNYLKDILLFALLSGPISCLVNTTWSNTLLILSGLTTNSFQYSWVTWWIGDSVGVLIFTPVFLILFSKIPEWKNRFFPILVPLLLSFILVVIANIFLHHANINTIQWYILFCGLIFCVFINIILFIIYGQKNLIQSKVDEQTNRLNKLAHYDSLTDLPNRFSFIEQLLSTMLESKSNNLFFAVCFIDVDNFKQVNDNFGHNAGDQLIINIAELIKFKLHTHDYMARLGGDEFGLLITQIESLDTFNSWLKELIEFVNQPTDLNNYQITKTISVGVSFYPQSTLVPEELLRLSDIAMYHAKKAGKNTYRIYDQEMHELVHRRQQIDHYMLHAIANNEFYLLYQTQVDLKNQNIVGIEALCYWNNPHLGGHLSPMEFISIAEENGLIVKIGEWAFRKACEDFKTILSSANTNNLVLAVNLSVIQLEDDRFLNYADKILFELEIDKSCIVFEVTESALMKNLKKSMSIMHAFHQSGYQFAIDDFGTGYSSMEYLHYLPISVLKIDKEFIQDILKDTKSEIIIDATIQLAKNLDIKTIAEGVETEEQMAFLKSHGCEQAQGYYYAKPLRIEELIKKLRGSI